MKLAKFKRFYKHRGQEIEDYVFSASEKEATWIERPLEKKKLKFFWWVIIGFLAISSARIFYLNIVKGSHYQEIARGNSIRSIAIKAPRGKIFDQKGALLVNNVPAMDAVAIPADWPGDENQRKANVKKIADIFKISEDEILVKMKDSNKRSFQPFLLKENISQEEMLVFAERSDEFSGVVIEKTAVREYVDSSIFSHLLGYVGKIEQKELSEYPNYSLTDYVGKQGIEKTYEKYLRGSSGAMQVEVDSLGNVKKERGIIVPRAGDNLVLNIDARLQKKIHDTIFEMLEKNQTKTAAAAVIDPRDGAVKALVSLPSFDNNSFVKKISREDYLKIIQDPDKPLFNRAVAGEYPPGSVLKPLIAAAALSEGIVSSSTSIDCHGGINVGEYRFGDWKTHGIVDIKKAIAESCNVFFYAAGGGWSGIRGLGIDRIKKYANEFGLGAKSGIDLPGETAGFIPDEEWKMKKFNEKWFVGDSYHASIGQGYVAATPVQIANYIAAIANGGTLFEPRIVNQIRKENGEVVSTQSKKIKEGLMPSEVARVVREGMREAVISGSARFLNDLPVKTAGKTGTAQFGSEGKTHAWFVSFAPYDDPEIALAILVEGGGEGSSSAVPVAKKIYQWYFSSENEF